jgi:transcriptional regulator with XRE-family HTH domain
MLFFGAAVHYNKHMSIIHDDPGKALARRIRTERETRGWSLTDLAARSGLSKAMLSNVERAAASPTAGTLVRIASAFGLTLSGLIARAEQDGGQLLRAADQPAWQDPDTGYVRRHVSPQSDVPTDLVHVTLPAKASVSFPAASYAFVRHYIWLIEGRLDFIEGETTHHLHPGDCLKLGAPVDCTYHAPGPADAVYLVVVMRQ